MRSEASSSRIKRTRAQANASSSSSSISDDDENLVEAQSDVEDEEDINVVNTKLLEKSAEPQEYKKNREFCRANGVVPNASQSSSLAHSKQELRELQHFVSQCIISLLNKYEITQGDGRPYVSSSPKGFLQYPDAWLAQHGYRLEGWPRGLPEKAVSVWPTAALLCIACMFVRGTIDLKPLGKGIKKANKTRKSTKQTDRSKRKGGDREELKNKISTTSDGDGKKRKDVKGKRKAPEREVSRSGRRQDGDDSDGEANSSGSDSFDRRRKWTKRSSNVEYLRRTEESDGDSDNSGSLNNDHKRSSLEIQNDVDEDESASELEVEEELGSLATSLRSRSVDSSIPKADCTGHLEDGARKKARKISATPNINSFSNTTNHASLEGESIHVSALPPKYSRKRIGPGQFAGRRDTNLLKAATSSSSSFPFSTDLNNLLKRHLAGSDMSHREVEKLAEMLLFDSQGHQSTMTEIMSKIASMNASASIPKRKVSETSESESESESDTDSSSSSSSSSEDCSSSSGKPSPSNDKAQKRIKGRTVPINAEQNVMEMSSCERDTTENVPPRPARKRTYSSRAGSANGGKRTKVSSSVS